MGVKPQAEAPHSAPVAPRGALRRRLRRRTTCTARARTQRHRSVAARARAGPTWESERISSVARALQGARRKGRAGRWHPERLSSDAPEAGRSGAMARARAVATDRLDKWNGQMECTKFFDLLMLSAGPPEGGFVPKPPFHREHQDMFIVSGPRRKSKEDRNPLTPRTPHARTRADINATTRRESNYPYFHHAIVDIATLFKTQHVKT